VAALNRLAAAEATLATDDTADEIEPPLPRPVTADCAEDSADFSESTCGAHWLPASVESLSRSVLTWDRLLPSWLAASFEMLILPSEATEERSALTSEHTAESAVPLLLEEALLEEAPPAAAPSDPPLLDPHAATRQHAAKGSTHRPNLDIDIPRYDHHKPFVHYGR
jgi:hypothetical protein